MNNLVNTCNNPADGIIKNPSPIDPTRLTDHISDYDRYKHCITRYVSTKASGEVMEKNIGNISNMLYFVIIILKNTFI